MLQNIRLNRSGPSSSNCVHTKISSEYRSMVPRPRKDYHAGHTVILTYYKTYTIDITEIALFLWNIPNYVNIHNEYNLAFMEFHLTLSDKMFFVFDLNILSKLHFQSGYFRARAYHPCLISRPCETLCHYCYKKSQSVMFVIFYVKVYFKGIWSLQKLGLYFLTN